MTEQTIADAAERERALDVSRSFIVQAPAGSGKTELLTQRFLCLLAEVRHPEEIYAITFTRKAAAEMRNRILAALDAAGDEQPTQPHRRRTWQLARAALAQDARQGWQIASSPNRLRVQTFDSLSHSLARQMPLLSALGAAPGTSEQPANYYREAARATLRMLDDDTLGPHVERLLVHLDNRQGQLEDLLCGMLARREQWLGHTLAAPQRSDIEEALDDAVTSHLRQLRDACGPGLLQQLCDIAHHAADRLDPTRAGTPEPDSLGAWREYAAVPGTQWSALPHWLGLAELVLTRGNTPRKQWNADIGFPAPSEAGIGAATKAQRQQDKASIRELCEQLHADEEAVALWAGLRVLPQSGLDAQQQAVLNSLFAVLLHAATELQLVFADNGEVDFAEIQMRARRALGSPDEPTDLALSLDYRLQHLLVDEFQDTSSSQYELLATLTAGWQQGDGRTLFAVGDPMQSIYRFREAEVGLYLSAREHGIGQLRLTALRLQVNFRSTGAIVDWVNAAFPVILPHSEDPGRGAVPYSAAIALDAHKDPLAVQVHPFAASDTRAEAAHVLELVRAALRETADGQVAVLARARSHLHAIALALKEAGIAFQAVDVDPLALQPVVRDLYHLTRALLHPADRLAWMVVLRAPWLGLGLPDLLTIAEASPRCIPARLRDPAVQAALSTDGRARVERLLQILDRQLPARGRRPLRQWVEGIWLRLGGLAVATTVALPDAQAYLRLLDLHEQAGGLFDFAELEAALARLYATPDSHADGRVQLMTMHKAKGLEFDTVILPGLGRRPRGSIAELLYWLERTGADGRTRLLMAPIRASEQAADPISGYLRELDRDKGRLETSRLLYVAATRAKRRLHLLGHITFNSKGDAGKPVADSLLEKLWPVIGDAFTPLQAPPATRADLPAVNAAALWRLPADWRPAGATLPSVTTAPPDTGAVLADVDFDWAGDTARHVGTLVHRHLEQIATQGPEHWTPERIAGLQKGVRLGLRNLGVDADEVEQAVTRTLRALQQTLAHETGRWILDAHKDARCEWPLTFAEQTARHYVIDRSFVDPKGVRWIIDYKTGEHLDGDRDAFLDSEQERYRAQLENYGRIVRALEDRPIRLALYFPLFPDWRVWDYAG